MNRTLHIRRGACTAAILAALAATALGPGLAMAQSATTLPPSTPLPPVVSVYAAQPDGSVSSRSSMSIIEDRRTIKIEMKNGVVTRAEIDGQVVPDERIENDGGTVRLKDESGQVVYEYHVPGFSGADFAAPVPPDVSVWQLFGGRGLPGTSGFGAISIAEPETIPLPFEQDGLEAPAVMIGVQMGVPDSTLCGHLGLKREHATLITAVHEGLPAASAGLEPYDLVVSVNGQDDADPGAIRAAFKDRKPGDTVSLSVIHRGVRKDVTLKLEAYDRKRLAESKVNRIAAEDAADFFAIAPAPDVPMPPLPPSIPEEYRKQIEQYLKQHGGGSAWGSPRAWSIKRYGGPGVAPPAAQSEAHKRLLADIERQQAEASRMAEQAARQAQELARRAAELHLQPGDPAADMHERMRRMEKMLEELMNQKLQQPKPQEPKEQDAGNRS